MLLHVENSFTWTKQNNSKNKLKPSKHKHKLNTMISSKIGINKQNYKNNYLYLTLRCKGLGIKKQDIPQRITIACCCSSVCGISWQPEYKIMFITIVHNIVNNSPFNILKVKVIILNSYLIVFNIIPFNLLHFNSN